MKKKFFVYTQYKGEILGIFDTYEEAEEFVEKRPDLPCIAPSNCLKRWEGKAWKVGDILPLKGPGDY